MEKLPASATKIEQKAEKMKTTLNKLSLALLLAAGMTSAHATYIESGDASNFLASAQLATDMQIQGTIGQGDEGDVYKLVFGTGGLLTINATGQIGTNLDTNIALFDAGFQALAGNDDANGLDSMLTYVISAGTYYIGIGDYEMYAISASNQAWFMDGLPPAGFGAVSQIENLISIDPGAYTLTLSVQARSNGVPEPATVGLLGLGLLGLGMMRRKRA